MSHSCSDNSVQANVRQADVKARRAFLVELCRNYIGAGTSEIRRMLIGRELFNETR